MKIFNVKYNIIKNDPKKEFEAQELLNNIANVANSMKAFGGIAKGLKDPELFGRKEAMENYRQHEYEKAIKVYSELIKADASYNNAEYADSFLQLAAGHNLAGVKEYSKGRFEQAAKEFENAMCWLDTMKKSTGNYDEQRCSGLKAIYEENKNRTFEKKEKKLLLSVLCMSIRTSNPLERTSLRVFMNPLFLSFLLSQPITSSTHGCDLTISRYIESTNHVICQ